MKYVIGLVLLLFALTGCGAFTEGAGLAQELRTAVEDYQGAVLAGETDAQLDARMAGIVSLKAQLEATFEQMKAEGKAWHDGIKGDGVGGILAAAAMEYARRQRKRRIVAESESSSPSAS